MSIDYRKIAVSGVITALICFAIVFGGKIHLSAKGEALLSLRTVPESVQFKMDGQALFDGQYTTTPIEFPVKKGRHVLKVVRAGFASQIIRLDVNSDEPIRMENIVLGESQNYATATAKFSHSGIHDKVIADIDRGFINKVLPFVASDLESEQTHFVRFTVESSPEKQSFSCNFQIARDGPSQFDINLTAKKGILSASNCH